MTDRQFEQEVLAFARLKPQLLQQYSGRVVGIYQGEIVAVGDNRLDVLDQVWDQFGEVSCYIELSFTHKFAVGVECRGVPRETR